MRQIKTLFIAVAFYFRQSQTINAQKKRLMLM
jgi:hypothetical protein